MAKSRTKRGMGPLLKEMRASPAAALVNGVLGVGGILGGGLVLVLRLAGAARKTAPGEAASTGSLLLYVFLIGIFLVAGAGFLLFALLHMTTRIRIFGRGLVWRRYGNKRVILWVEVEHFSRGESAATTLTSWSMLLRSGERIDLHSGLYNSNEFADTMELIAEQVEEARKQFG